MIFDEAIIDPNAKSIYLRRRTELAKVVHAAKNLVISVVDCLKNKPNPNKENYTAPLLLCRHVLEMVDGIAVLIDSGCAEPCKNLLRSALEANLGLLYILTADSDNRSLAYQAAHAHKHIKLYKKHDQNTEQGKEFAKKMSGDFFWQSVKLPFPFAKMVQNLENMLKRPEFVPIEAEWQATKRKMKSQKQAGDPQWYSLFGGPSNVYKLAESLDMKGYYEFLYRWWSDSIHAGSAMSQIKGVQIDGKWQGIILPLRNPDNLQMCGSVAISFCLMAATALLEKYVPEERPRFVDRYKDEVQKEFLAINEAGPLIAVPWTSKFP